MNRACRFAYGLVGAGQRVEVGPHQGGASRGGPGARVAWRSSVRDRSSDLCLEQRTNHRSAFRRAGTRTSAEQTANHSGQAVEDIHDGEQERGGGAVDQRPSCRDMEEPLLGAWPHGAEHSHGDTAAVGTTMAWPACPCAISRTVSATTAPIMVAPAPIAAGRASRAHRNVAARSAREQASRRPG